MRRSSTLAGRLYLKFGKSIMSRIGKQQIEIPENTQVTQDGGVITVKGPLGELSREFRREVKINIDDKEITLTPSGNSKFVRSLWGTYGSHLKNMIDGVGKNFEKKLVIEGVGYKAEMQGNTLVLSVGFSHKVNMDIPEGLAVSVEKNVITISGINKETVGQFTSKIRLQKKPEPYKGKGIRYENEVVKRKQGKKTA